MGSQPRRSGRRGSRRGRGRRGGGVGAGGEGEDDRNAAEETRRRARIYRKARRKLVNALKSDNFSYAARIATSVTISQAPVRDVVSLFLAGAEAFREGKEEEWAPELEELVSDGLRYAQKETGYELTPDTRELFSSILATNLRRVGEKKGRKYS